MSGSLKFVWPGANASPSEIEGVRRRRTTSRSPAAEQTALWQLVNAVRARIERELHPGGYNLGVNVGESAGQTVGHVHIHLTPRYPGDVDDPRGGIRWIIPAKAHYWEQA